MLDLEDSMDVWKETIFNTRHTRYPVCDGSADKIVGVLNAKEYFRLKDKSREFVMQNAVRPAYFVPDTVKADVLFRNMKRERQTLAVVMDEYGGMTGIITMNDLVEQLVGDLVDDTKVEEVQPIEPIEDGVWRVHGSALLEDVAEVTKVTLPYETFDTFNGLIFHTLGNIPKDGADIEVDVCGLHVSVTQIQNHQVEVAVVSLIDEEATES